MKRLMLLLILACLTGSACQSSGFPLTASPASQRPTYFPTVVGFSTQSSASGGRQVPPSPKQTLLAPSPTPTPFPAPTSYEPYTIDFLQHRTYGGGRLEVLETMEESDSFTRYLIRYPSDELSIYGFANVPKGDGPFPVILVLHGFVNPNQYETLDYTTPAADMLAQAGYLVIHPDLRGYPPSDNGDNLFRVGIAIDALNLIALLKTESGPSELFANAAVDRIGLWGHSQGGNIVLRVLTIVSDIKAALLYATMSGDEIKNAQLLSKVSPDPAFQTELTVPSAIGERIFPMYYYSNITSPIQLHHGTADQTIPVAWAEETCAALTDAGVQVECLYYPEEDHTFRRRVSGQFWDASLAFYQKHLSP